MIDSKKGQYTADKNPQLDLGYVFSPPCTSNVPCHRRLTINIRSSPTYLHFDPESVNFSVASPAWGTEFIKVFHPWLWTKKYNVLASRIIMRDRLNKVVEAFTFGGKLQIKTKDKRTRCSIVSNAPILPVEDWYATSSSLLAEEVEVLLAEWRKLFDESNLGNKFEEQLALVDPPLLYIICLDTLQGKFSSVPYPKPEYILKFTFFLKRQIQALREERKWPAYIPPMKKILNIRPKEN